MSVQVRYVLHDGVLCCYVDDSDTCTNNAVAVVTLATDKPLYCCHLHTQKIVSAFLEELKNVSESVSL